MLVVKSQNERRYPGAQATWTGFIRDVGADFGGLKTKVVMRAN